MRLTITKAIASLSIGALLFAAANIQSTPVQASAPAVFKDVKQSDWYYSSIQKLISKGYVNGFADGTFKPQKEISRAEFIKLVGAALQLDISAATGTWYTPFVNAAVAAGIHKTSEYNGNWSQPITRQEMARLSVRAVDEKLRQGKTSDPQLVYEATKRGILSGLSGGELGLKEKSTRAQATVVIDRVLTLLDGSTLPMDKRAASYAEVAYKGTNVETMWGGEFRTLPFKSEIRPYINGEFQQILIIDMDDKESPYRNSLPEETFKPVDTGNPKGVVKLSFKPWKNEYLMAIKVRISNTKAFKYKSQFKNMIGTAYFEPVMFFPENSKGLFNSSWFFDANNLNFKEMWVLYAVKKEYINKAKKDNYPYFYFEAFGTRDFVLELNTDGRIFWGENK